MPYCEEASRADRCVDYEAFMDVVLAFYNKVVELREHSSLLTFKVWSSYLALVLIIMVNGLRVREAIKATRIFYETGDRRITINAVKRGDKRLVIIPEFMEREDLEHLYKMLIKTGEENTKRRVSDFIRRVFRVNPHSLRYAFIRYHILTGKTPEEIARALGLREKDNIKKYYLRGLNISMEG
jgi:hypothetical protein